MSGFDHFATVYRSDDEFIAQVLPFVEQGIAKNAAILVALDTRKIELLEDGLGADAAKLQFEDMRQLGRNPGAIISRWVDFARANAPRPLVGVGEPAWPGRSDTELDECRHHECLLNAAFADATDFRLLCPYDGSGLGAAVIERVFESHPRVVTAEGDHPSDSVIAPEAMAQLLDEPLSGAPPHAAELDFELRSLGEVRAAARVALAAVHIEDTRARDFVLAVNELAENSIRHGSGRGRLRIWADGGRLTAEVTDSGRLSDPLAGRRRPTGDLRGGHGLWLTHQVCDLVQVRSSGAGTTVRAHMLAPVAA